MNNLYLIWTSYNSGQSYLLGELSKKNDRYIFVHNMDESLKAKEEGCFLPFKLNVPAYISSELFPFFKNRIMDKKRESIQEILNKLDLSKYDESIMLALTGGKKVTDNFEVLTAEELQNRMNDNGKKRAI